MYAAVPRMTPAPVNAALIVGEPSEVRLKPDAAIARMYVVAGFRWTGELRESEVQHLHRAVVLHLDVGGLQIAMDEAVLVCRVERVGDLTVSVASPTTLYRMKKDTVRLKDKADAELLRQQFKLDEEE